MKRLRQFSSLPETPGLINALCALAFYRHRHDNRKRYKSGRRSALTVSVDTRGYIALARNHITLARQAGWRGSIRRALGVIP